MQFLSNNLFVTVIDDNNNEIIIKTTDAKNPWVSYDLDQLRAETTKLVNEHDKFIASNREKIDANDPSIIEKYISISNRIKKSTIDYLSKCIINIDSHMDLLRSIRGDDMPALQSAIQRSQFGIIDGDDKKKQTSVPTSKSSSKPTVTRKKK
jgi:hypothetical protein